MSSLNNRRFREQIRFLRRQFLQDGGLPFTDVLSEQSISDALTQNGVCWKDRIYTPLTTLWVFLGQILCTDQSCASAVARLIAHRVSRGQNSCSSETSAYCQARKRLPEKFFSDVARRAGRALDDAAKADWLWHGRRVYLYDGSTVTMPDTPANQSEYPQPSYQRPGLGHPMARVCVLVSLSCGAIVDMAIGAYSGKGQSELGLLRRLLDAFRPGDVMVADRLMCSWVELTALQCRGVDFVVRHASTRKLDFRRGQRLGKDDQIVSWPKRYARSKADSAYRKDLPDSLRVRVCRIRIARPGFRDKVLVVATTLFDPIEYPKEELASLYRERWNVELDIRSLKQTLQMDRLRCKTPELVRKEIWTHVLAYNLIHTIMARAADDYDVEPRTISFKTTLQTLKAFQPILANCCSSDFRQQIYDQLIESVAVHRVGDRPNRIEPRKIKQPSRKHHDFLHVHRHEAKRQILKGLRK
ncbi:IS4 family transposase [Planctomycetes bacterium K23_9]|uniref:Transposase DDE domain protein n=1 Tax=Stieleria marina TaxID=1930275 RepID=A0A517NUD1_9BACT|nr:Transposase DDE domain protein [Planctomycetes bacterium K23_9]